MLENPSMVRIGIVGMGFMGMTHYRAAQKLKGARVTAICSREPRKLAGDWRGIRGNFGDPGAMTDLSKVTKYDRLEALLDDPEIDLVDICNPTNLHAPTAVAALKAGKHVLVEKAIALDPKEADAMLRAATHAGKLLMVAHVLPFFPEFAYAAKTVKESSHGRMLGAHFKRVISKPDWSAEIGDAAKTGGPAIDLHIHDAHFIGLLCGVPHRVYSTGVEENGAVSYLTTSYLYGRNGPAVTCSSGAICQKGRPFVHGFDIYLERATLLYESGVQPLTLLLPDGKVKHPKLKGGTDVYAAFAAELQAAVDGVRSGTEPDLLSGKLARDALVMCFKECQSARTGKAVAIR
jgi:predicted dehydrogenase